jgi:hypothetical protein
MAGLPVGCIPCYYKSYLKYNFYIINLIKLPFATMVLDSSVLVVKYARNLVLHSIEYLCWKNCDL